LLAPPINVPRASIHPEGIVPHIVNLAEWRHHLLAGPREEADRSCDPTLTDLHEELRAFPAPVSRQPLGPLARIPVPLTVRDPASGAILSFLSTTAFDTATDVTLA
jgi:hypothetical protein